MSNNWHQLPSKNQNAENTSAPRRSSGLLSDYRQHIQPQQPPQPQQQPPQPQQPPQQPQQQPPQPQLQYNQYSPLPPTQGPRMANPYSPIPSGPQAQGPVNPAMQESQLMRQGWVAQTVDMVRRFSGKVAAVNGMSRQQAPEPMVLYHPPRPGSEPQPETKATPWKRSRALRITRQRKNRRARWERTHPSGQKIAIGVVLALLLLIVVSVSSGSAYAFSYYQSQLPRLQEIANLHISQTSRIYDRNGVLLNERYDQSTDQGGRRTPISFKNVPKVMQDAMTSAEDPTFWTNTGVDPQGILRAANGLASSHSIQGGGSTITQQVIKNMTNDKDQTFNRKITEAALAIGLTQQYPKWQILEMYLNVAPFANHDLGVEAAMQELFQVKPKCDIHFNCLPAIAQINYNAATKKQDPLLGLARASLLAGMPQSPFSYDPTRGPNSKKLALARQDYVLNQMMRYQISVDGIGQLTPDTIHKAEALTAKMPFTPYPTTKLAPHFVDWVTQQVADVLGNGDEEVGLHEFLTGGFNIRTTIDVNLENYVESAVKHHLTQPEVQPFTQVYAAANQYYNINDGAVVVENSKTGEILAMDGSLDYNFNSNDALLNKQVSGEVNVATANRSPGSTFKPFVYATAFEMGWSPGLVVPDFKTYFPNGAAQGTATMGGGGPTNSGGTYAPPDYGGNDFHHDMNSTIRVALANSFNVPAVKAMSYAGIDNVLNTARRMGVTGLKNEGVAQALGASGTSLLQMTSAYQTFANQGTRVPAQGVLDIWDNYGHNLYHYDPNTVKGTRVLSPEVSYMVTSVLTDEDVRNLEFGTNHSLSFWDWDGACSTAPWRVNAGEARCVHDVAAKTGTTDGFVDNWTIGYTPNVVVGVWAGNANNDQMTNNPTGITGAGPIWHSVAEYVSGHCNVAIDNIPCPKDINKKALDLTQPDQFTPPADLTQYCTGGGGNNGKNNNNTVGAGCDWVIQGQQPTLTNNWQNCNNNNGNNGNNNNGNNGNNNGCNNNGNNNGNNNNGNNNGGNNGNNNGGNNGNNNGGN